MFENLLGQEAGERLAADLAAGTLPSSLLFAGPPASGKATAALELARVLSCDRGTAAWNCPCRSCESHRLLAHPDLLVLGPRTFAPELSASAAAFLREPASAARLLFLRAARKLLVRLSPVLWEGDESKFSKIVPLASGMEEDLEELSPGRPLLEPEKLKKLVESVRSAALKLEAEAISDTTPIAQVRRAAYWARLAPSGKRKLILVENADRMQEGSRNALLKILEEPPETATLVLATARRGAMMPTILSRVRNYRFAQRSPETEREVVRRVFRDADAANTGFPGLAGYLDAYLPVKPAELEEAALCFLSAPDGRAGAAAVLERTGKFEGRAQFRSFLALLLDAVSAKLRALPPSPRAAIVGESASKAVREAEEAVGSFNQSPGLALERLHAALAPLVRTPRRA